MGEIRKSLIADPNEEALFVNVNGMRMSRQGFWKILKHYQETARIDKEITPHSLRHSFATRCIESRCDYKTVSALLGHSNISTTLNLYVHPNMEQKKRCVEQMFRSHWK